MIFFYLDTYNYNYARMPEELQRYFQTKVQPTLNTWVAEGSVLGSTFYTLKKYVNIMGQYIQEEDKPLPTETLNTFNKIRQDIIEKLQHSFTEWNNNEQVKGKEDEVLKKLRQGVMMNDSTIFDNDVTFKQIQAVVTIVYYFQTKVQPTFKTWVAEGSVLGSTFDKLKKYVNIMGQYIQEEDKHLPTDNNTWTETLNTFKKIRKAIKRTHQFKFSCYAVLGLFIGGVVVVVKS